MLIHIFTGMYFCYVDESGDYGTYDPTNPNKTGSPYFIMAGLIVHAESWKYSLDILKMFRKNLAAQCYLPYNVEIHCAEMIDPHKIKEYTQISTSDRWKVIEDFAEKIGANSSFSIITVVIDKSRTVLTTEEYLTRAVTKLYQVYNQFLKERKQVGIVLFDRANEKPMQTQVRKLVGSGPDDGAITDAKITQIIEDAFFKNSTDSMFIQCADVIAYTLKEKEFPRASRKKFNAHRIFTNKLKRIAYHSAFSDVDGVVRL